MERRRIKLEKFTSVDFEKFYQLVKDEDVMAMITEEATPLHIAKLDFDLLLKNNELNVHLGYFKVFDLETDSFIGLGKIEIESKDANSAELGYMLLPSFWRKGFASEIARQLIAVAQHENRIEKLTAIIDPNNLASRKILVNNGFTSVEIDDLDGLPAEVFNLKL